ncbi:MAG: hypothetical protein ACLS6W_06095 [Ruminococcus sp.]
MKKWHQKSIAIFTAAACLLAGGTIGLSQESLSKLQRQQQQKQKTQTW